VAARKWISLVDAALNNNYPCANGLIAAAAYDSTHSGPLQAGVGTRIISSADVTLLSTSTLFTVCYAEAGGITTSTWADSGIRLTVSKISSTLYGVEAGRTARTTTSVPAANDCFPQVANAKITYVGDLANNMYVSLVDATLNNGNPCTTGTELAPTGTEAGAAADATHSGGSTAAQAAASTKEVTISQATLLNAAKTYAVCYAETSGSTTDNTWRDSHIRYKITKIESITVTSNGLAASYQFKTSGQYASIATLTLTYSGSLINNKYVSLVDSTLSSSDPCSAPAHAGAGADTTHSGKLQAGTGNKIITLVNTLSMNSAKTYAVCYAETSGSNTDTTWADAGIRMTKSKIDSVTYGAPVRTMTSETHAEDVLPQLIDTLITYTGDLGNFKWLSLVDSTLGDSNPCVLGSVVAADSTSTVTGALQAATASKVVTLPQSIYIDITKLYAVCYAETSGSPSDTTWADSIIRLKASKIEYLTASSVVHRTTGGIARISSLSVTYTGTLLFNKYLSLVDSTLNSNDPCASSAVAQGTQDATHSGVKQAGTSDSIVTFDTSGLSTAITFAACYAETLGTWLDIGIRLKISQIESISYSVPARILTSDVKATNRLPQATGMIVTYAGNLASNKWVSLVDATYNGANPCVAGSVAAVGHDPAIAIVGCI
jgi:hypothetical protein